MALIIPEGSTAGGLGERGKTARPHAALWPPSRNTVWPVM